MIYFIPERPFDGNPDTLVKTNYRLLQSLPFNSRFTEKYIIEKPRDQNYSVVPFRQNAQNSDGVPFYDRYGVNLGESHQDFMTRWLAYFGFIFCWFIFILHAIYIGNGYLYKVDNLLILAQTYYYFQFVHLHTGSYLSQFYYGWRWSHGGFCSNFFARTIPDGYYDESSPEPYKLVSMDSTFIRNAGFSLSLFAALLAILIITFIIIVLVYKCCSKR